MIDCRLRLSIPVKLVTIWLRKRISTDQPILDIRTLINGVIDQRSPIVLIFVDIKRTFYSLPAWAIVQLFMDLLYTASRAYFQPRWADFGVI